VIGSIRRECLDHLIVFNEASLRRALRSYFDYYHKSRTHLSLGKDSPDPRPIQPVEMGRVVAVPQVGGLHHRYERRAACATSLLLLMVPIKRRSRSTLHPCAALNSWTQQCKDRRPKAQQISFPPACAYAS
jgi:hypothetical protein